jgi:CopG antitoxin of type II toxin-antitoxin system
MSKKRLQVELSDDAYVRLSQAANQEGRPVAEVVRRALNIEDYLRSEQSKGGKVMIEEQDGTKRQLVIA